MTNMKSNENINIKWNDFQKNISTTWKELQESGEFADITLACGDNTVFLAHQIILASCSSVFRSLVSRLSPQPQALVFLQGVEARHLALLLNYIYQGEVTVDQDNLKQFLILAEELKVQGLAEEPTRGTDHEESCEVTKEPKHIIKKVKTSFNEKKK